MSNSDYASERLSEINSRITKACMDSGRSKNELTLIGASKRQSAELISQFIEQGLNNLGENYLQEAVDKQQQLSDLGVQWHFIGQIQSNKTKTIAQHFSWVHGVDRLKIAQRLASQNPRKSPINILIQLNPDAEQSKGGVLLKEAAELCDEIAQIDGLALKGFMMIPKAREDIADQAAVFAQAKALLDSTNQRFGLSLTELSMGMSGDLAAAIQEGSTMVRVGTDLFGARI
jgi:pyridoxal phosphate enzyme (YggS family)